ncbi:MAG: hypothetical protein JW908_13855 [Anaerolineales bacterium]|nr:hypothetical protein [Anaerolineales bacterium]
MKTISAPPENQADESAPVTSKYTGVHFMIAGMTGAAFYALSTWLSMELQIPGKIPPPIAPILSLLSTPGILLNYIIKPSTTSNYRIIHFLGSLIFWFVIGYFSLKITNRIWAALIAGVVFAVLTIISGFGILLIAMQGMSP